MIRSTMEGGSKSDSSPEIAVWMRDVCKSYGSCRSKLQILHNLEMTVPKGAIYGLLGPSGCGKTTLLKCVVGKLKVDRGTVMCLGAPPGSPGHAVPGCKVGYMPQEIALYNEFTISETLLYFGILHGMSWAKVKERTAFLLEFLSLPDKSRLINTLSGGQKRRVSFAAALLQEPELLILDEPTVGVDPLLRERIWDHMIYIAKTSKITIIITTHYIEEARQADMVGLMRNGRLLAEETPSQLMMSHQMNNLEAVFLKLCQIDQNVASSADSITGVYKSSTSRQLSYDIPPDQAPDEETPLLSSAPVPDHVIHNATCKQRARSYLPRFRNVLASIFKNVTVMRRQMGLLIFEFIFPSIQIVLFCLCIGRDPFDLNIAVVNQDFGFFGKTFLQNLDNNTLKQTPFCNSSSALQSVKDGDSWGTIFINENFTDDLMIRFATPQSLTNATLNGSTILLHLDMTNEQVALIIQEKVIQGFQNFAFSLLEQIGMNPSLADIPVKIVQPPVYGEKNPSFTNFMAPGIVLSITFFMATGLTTLSFVLERKEGLLERGFVAGLTAFEIMLAHVMTQMLVLAVQVTLMLVFAIALFKVPYRGPLVWVVILVLFQGLCGMNLGILFSAVCDQETSAIQLALSSVYPNLLLSGIIWPLEAIPTGLQYISKILPMTYATEAMRCIMSRGWDMSYFPVYRGYLVTLGWCFGILTLAAICLRVRL